MFWYDVKCPDVEGCGVMGHARVASLAVLLTRDPSEWNMFVHAYLFYLM